MLKVRDIVVPGNQRPMVATIVRWHLAIAARSMNPTLWRGTLSGERNEVDECVIALQQLGQADVYFPRTRQTWDSTNRYIEWCMRH